VKEDIDNEQGQHELEVSCMTGDTRSKPACASRHLNKIQKKQKKTKKIKNKTKNKKFD
jgi:hypothetical protein